MSYFVIPKCAQQGCLSWRVGDKCAKNQMAIQKQIRFIAHIHSSAECEVRRQISEFRLEKLIKG